MQPLDYVFEGLLALWGLYIIMKFWWNYIRMNKKTTDHIIDVFTYASILKRRKDETINKNRTNRD